MWIAEAKMMKETESLVNQDFDFFPLTNNANIVEGNALRMDWNDVIPANQLSWIMGIIYSEYSMSTQGSTSRKFLGLAA